MGKLNLIKCLITLICLLATICLLLLPSTRAEAQPESLFLDQFEAPDALFFIAVRKGLEEYRNTRPYKNQWDIKTDNEKGILETNWYPEHKGEVKLKVQIVVWGKHFRLDVWQKVGIFRNIKKTDWSRRTERHIQESIEKVLIESKM